VIKGKKEQLWDRPRKDLQVFNAAFDVGRLRDLVKIIWEWLHM
jgi:hypothetical protein